MGAVASHTEAEAFDLVVDEADVEEVLAVIAVELEFDERGGGSNVGAGTFDLVGATVAGEAQEFASGFLEQCVRPHMRPPHEAGGEMVRVSPFCVEGVDLMRGMRAGYVQGKRDDLGF
ncbi:unnamed protein product [Linum trigynum]|uniref:Uncharacterized protein n=1 Tax=Linum trigynum TaxID=586398 RepID=A0AAV2DEL6_9ROSI